ncbi:MAG: ATP-binding protein [Cellvibrionaceae bacterium]|nr:ATP-binding protein [Cellvibrionaceae bacterium]
MEDKVLNGLIIAFQAAPSSELAKLIWDEYLSRKNYAELGQYIDLARPLFDDTDLQNLARIVCEYDSKETHSLLDALDTEQIQKVIEHLILSGQKALAKNFYLNRLEIEAAVRKQSLQEAFELEDNRVKLKVIEKSDADSVVLLFQEQQVKTTFNDIVGLDEVKKQVNKKIILPFQKPSLFKRFKKKVGGGVLLYGPPGCGKTLLARATSGECKASFFNIEAADILDMYIGESEQKLRAVFEKARSEKPAVIFFDELEALAGKREHGKNATHNNIVSQFLSELDGFSQANDGILVLASTNVPWSIDAAFLRPGRFDRMFFVPPPDAQAREGILKHHMAGRPSDSGINYKAIAQKASGYSGADLANLIEMAADEAIEESIEQNKDSAISQAHLSTALQDSQATTTEWLTTARNYARYANDGSRYNDVLSFIKKHGK